MRIRKSVLFPVLAAILSFIFVAGYFDRGDKPEAALPPENGVLEVENGIMTGVGKRLVNPDAS
jgi:hypothetical protein